MILKRFAGALPRASGVKTYGLPDERVSVILAQKKKKIENFAKSQVPRPKTRKISKKKKRMKLHEGSFILRYNESGKCQG